MGNDADDGGTTDNGTDDGIHNNGDGAHESVMKVIMMTIFGRGRYQDDADDDCDGDEDGNIGGDDEDDDGTAIMAQTMATTLAMLMSICR